MSRCWCLITRTPSTTSLMTAMVFGRCIWDSLRKKEQSRVEGMTCCRLVPCSLQYLCYMIFHLLYQIKCDWAMHVHAFWRSLWIRHARAPVCAVWVLCAPVQTWFVCFPVVALHFFDWSVLLVFICTLFLIQQQPQCDILAPLERDSQHWFSSTDRRWPWEHKIPWQLCVKQSIVQSHLSSPQLRNGVGCQCRSVLSSVFFRILKVLSVFL